MIETLVDFEPLWWLRQMLKWIVMLALAVGSGGFAYGQPPEIQAASESHLLDSAVQRLEHYIAAVQPLLDRYGYAAVFTAVAVEGIGIPAPGQTLLMAAAVEAAQGRLNIAWLVALAWLAAVLGNSLGYLLGRWGGRSLLARLGVSEQRLQRLEQVFNRYGGGVVLVGRFFDGLRQLNGIVAGISAMPGWRFSAFNGLGALLWTGLWGLGTYYLDKDIQVVLAFFERIEPVIVVLSLLGVVGLVVYLLRRRTRTPSGD